MGDRGGHHHCSLFKCPSGWYGVLSASWYSLGIALEERSAASTPPVNDAVAGLFFAVAVRLEAISLHPT